jgi:hypothetical protein
MGLTSFSGPVNSDEGFTEGGVPFSGGASDGTTRGTVLMQAAQADSVAADTAAMVTDFNALLVKLRAAGVIAP